MSLSLIDIIEWGFQAVFRAKEWVSPDGRMNIQNQLSGKSTSLDLWPTAGTLPTVDSLAELTLHRKLWNSGADERLNVSAMVDSTDGGAYRIGIERSGTGQFRPLLIAFEDVTPGQALLALKVDLTGVYVHDDNVAGGWRKI